MERELKIPLKEQTKTTNSLLVSLVKQLGKGHRLKNRNCKLRELKRIPIENKVLLIGTPLQNNLAELWSLLNFILPDVFPSHEEFESWFDLSGRCSNEAQQEEFEEKRRMQVISKLHTILRPFLLRRCGVDASTEKGDNFEFNDLDSDVRIFLLSTRAGGLSINLTATDTCILYESNWNPQMDLQAMDRCHMKGQTKHVRVYRLAASNSVEGRVLKKAFGKLKREHLVIGKMRMEFQFYSVFREYIQSRSTRLSSTRGRSSTQYQPPRTCSFFVGGGFLDMITHRLI